MKIIVASVPGAGKTTVLKYVKKELPEAKVVHTGDLALEIVSKEFGIKDRDDIRKKLSVEQQRLVQNNIYEKISKMKDEIILIDTHLSFKTTSGYFPGLPDRTVEIIKPDAIVILEFNPKDVKERRSKDPTRKRDVETEEEIEEHQKINKSFAAAAAAVAECPIEVIDLRYEQKKPFEHAYKAAEQIIQLIKK